MSYEWFNELDSIGWHFESCVQQAISGTSGLLGAAPSAVDQIRTHLRYQSSCRTPLQLLDEVEGVTEAEVKQVIDEVARGAVQHAAARGSQHVTREDVTAIVGQANYPFTPRD